MRRFILAIALACALSGSAMAGEIHSTGPEPGETQTPPVPGATQGPSIAATVIETILSLVS
jgi:hypothetical protein